MYDDQSERDESKYLVVKRRYCKDAVMLVMFVMSNIVVTKRRCNAFVMLVMIEMVVNF